MSRKSHISIHEIIFGYEFSFLHIYTDKAQKNIYNIISGSNCLNYFFFKFSSRLFYFKFGNIFQKPLDTSFFFLLLIKYG